ncbi:MAG: tRNA (adenosine(37)-N6)-dimethylallyltransferase MiaA [Acidobacteria bacterium]|nr:tRNA (adenosine(37)-N6)-dimethylallyltransferase MiaA [Acidobacteriota bacterium]
MNTQSALVAIVGPTASGKSHLAIALAKRFRGEILNCDSLQMYRLFDVGTAKLSPEERGGIPHHFLDVLNPDEQFAAGEYMRQARQVVAEITSRGKLPIVVGGTGFYLRALVDGLFPGPSRNRELRQRLARRGEQKGPAYLHRLLQRLDAATAAQIHPNDQPKLTRAIEVCLLTRQPASELFRQGRSKLEGYRVFKVGLNPPRDALFERINERTRWIFDHGLINEVQSILDKGYAPTVPPLGSHGYRQAVDFLEGRISLDEAIYHAQTRTRQYAKRQMTWFRKEAAVRWFNGFGSEPDIERQVIEFLSSPLALDAGKAEDTMHSEAP